MTEQKRSAKQLTAELNPISAKAARELFTAADRVTLMDWMGPNQRPYRATDWNPEGEVHPSLNKPRRVHHVSSAGVTFYYGDGDKPIPYPSITFDKGAEYRAAITAGSVRTEHGAREAGQLQLIIVTATGTRMSYKLDGGTLLLG